MNKHLVLQRFWNQLGCKEIMPMMKIVNIFTQHTDYLNTLCKNAYEMERNYYEQRTCTYNTVLHTEVYTRMTKKL